jgi:hypothetical protein
MDPEGNGARVLSAFALFNSLDLFFSGFPRSLHPPDDLHLAIMDCSGLWARWSHLLVLNVHRPDELRNSLLKHFLLFSSPC